MDRCSSLLVDHKEHLKCAIAKLVLHYTFLLVSFSCIFGIAATWNVCGINDIRHAGIDIVVL